METKPGLLTISETEMGYEQLAEWLADSGEYRLLRLSVTGITGAGVGAAIFNCEILGETQLNRLRQISAILGGKRILVLARQITVQAYRKVGSMENMTALQKPFQPDVFKTLVQRLFAKDEQPTATAFPRFITDEPVRALVLKTGLLIPTRMKNYSAGGAFLEYRGISVKVGDTIQVGLAPVEQVPASSAFLMKARVVWIAEGDGPRSPARGVGIQFVES